MVNTTNSVKGKEVRALSEMSEAERERALSNQPPRPHENGKVVTTDLYDSMESDGDPVPVQRLEAPGLHVFTEGDAGPELRQVDSLVVFSDGMLLAELGGEIVDPGEINGFVGFLCIEKPLRSEEDARDAFEKTKIEEV